MMTKEVESLSSQPPQNRLWDRQSGLICVCREWAPNLAVGKMVAQLQGPGDYVERKWQAEVKTLLQCMCVHLSLSLLYLHQ